MGIFDKFKDAISIFEEEETIVEKEVVVKEQALQNNRQNKTQMQQPKKDVASNYNSNNTNYYSNSNFSSNSNFAANRNFSSNSNFSNNVMKSNEISNNSKEMIEKNNSNFDYFNKTDFNTRKTTDKDIVIEKKEEKIEKVNEEKVIPNSEIVNLDYKSEVIKENSTLDVTKPLIESTENLNNTLSGSALYVEERKFKPSQMISPVYGVLDKNYKKEDIKVKDERLYEIPRRKSLNYEDIRKKAYGTLTDELEKNLYEENLKIKNTINNLDYLLSNLKTGDEKTTKNTIDALNNLEKTTQIAIETKGQIEVNDIFDITIPNIQIRNIEIDEESFDKTLIDVPLSVDLSNKLVDIEENLKLNNVKIIDHNNKDEINIRKTKNDLYDLISNMYKEGEGN